ncbi:MAG: hypothetical protein ACMUIP_15685, partial [bacterium]
LVGRLCSHSDATQPGKEHDEKRCSETQARDGGQSICLRKVLYLIHEGGQESCPPPFFLLFPFYE